MNKPQPPKKGETLGDLLTMLLLILTLSAVLLAFAYDGTIDQLKSQYEKAATSKIARTK